MKRIDNYIITQTLGKGYSGTVYLGEDKLNKNKVAVKVINKRIPNYIKLLKDS